MKHRYWPPVREILVTQCNSFVFVSIGQTAVNTSSKVILQLFTKSNLRGESKRTFWLFLVKLSPVLVEVSQFFFVFFNRKRRTIK